MMRGCSARSSRPACACCSWASSESLRSAEAGHHFARPGNRFYPALHAAGLTPRLLRPDEDALLPTFGLGVTNIAWRATRDAHYKPADFARLYGEAAAWAGRTAGL
jgi:double-stranded uracil-DNA glycosylase